MKKIIVSLLCLLLVSAALAVRAAELTPAEARAIATEAYLYGYWQA